MAIDLCHTVLSTNIITVIKIKEEDITGVCSMRR
jgi:hypothetical protein